MSPFFIEADKALGTVAVELATEKKTTVDSSNPSKVGSISSHNKPLDKNQPQQSAGIDGTLTTPPTNIDETDNGLLAGAVSGLTQAFAGMLWC